MSKLPRWIALLPAYGRDYKNKKEILEDFNNGKDFLLYTYNGSGYINKEQIEIGSTIEFRYKKLQNLFVYKVEEPPSMILTPTPGVDYKSKRSVLYDFNAYEEFAWERNNTLSYIIFSRGSSSGLPKEKKMPNLDLECVDCGRPSETYLCETCDSMRKLELDPFIERKHIEEEDYPDQIVSMELEPRNIRTFVLGGHAIFTLHNTFRGTHLTFKVRKCEDNPILFFVSVLTGPDNWANYTPLGTIREGRYWRNKSAKIAEEATSAKTFKWFWENLDKLPPALKVLHEGKCGKCGRKLTEPESISSGFGPICRSSLGM